MKKQIVLMVLAFLPVFLLAQSTSLTSLFKEYVSKPGFETAEIFPASMSFEWEKTMNLNSIKEIMKNIQSIRILKYKEDRNRRDQAKFWKKIQKAVGDGQYKEVVRVNAEKVSANIYMIKDPVGNTREIALAAKKDDGIIMVTITGNLDFSSLFSKENMEHLRELAHFYLHNKGECKPAKN